MASHRFTKNRRIQPSVNFYSDLDFESRIRRPKRKLQHTTESEIPTEEDLPRETSTVRSYDRTAGCGLAVRSDGSPIQFSRTNIISVPESELAIVPGASLYHAVQGGGATFIEVFLPERTWASEIATVTPIEHEGLIESPQMQVSALLSPRLRGVKLKNIRIRKAA